MKEKKGGGRKTHIKTCLKAYQRWRASEQENQLVEHGGKEQGNGGQPQQDRGPSLPLVNVGALLLLRVLVQQFYLLFEGLASDLEGFLLG